MVSVHTSSAPHIAVFEKREELRRILDNRYFSNSPKKTRFLDFVCEQEFQGNGDKLNEYLIGLEVYERGVDFNPQKDPIVRVQAHEIRRLLKKYYEEEGKGTTIRMDLPSGHYVPVFSRLAEEVGSEETAPLPVLPEKARVARLPWALATFFGILCLVLTAVLALNFANHRGSLAATQSQALPDSLGWFWNPFLTDSPLITIPNHPLLRAAHDGDSPQTLASGHEIPKASLPEFRDTIHFHELKRFVFVPSLTDFTSVGETLGMVSLCEMFATAGQKCRVQQSRLVNLDEIKGGERDPAGW